MRVIGFTGKKGHGKDYVANILSDKLKNSKMLVEKLTLADNIKHIVGIFTNTSFEFIDNNKNSLAYELSSGKFCGIETAKATSYFCDMGSEKHKKYIKGKIPVCYVSIRNMLQYFGTEMMQRNFGKNVWVNSIKNRIISLEKDADKYVYIITDIRFPHEYQIVKDLGGIIVEVVNHNIESNDIHISENGMTDLQPDFIISNDYQPNWSENEKRENDTILYEKLSEISNYIMKKQLK